MARVSLLCIAKLENLTIKDWVMSHKNKGIYHIYIYDNNDVGDDSLSEILKDEVNSGFVTIMQEFKGARACQVFSYNYFIATHYDKNEYDWLGIIDCDEYLDFTTKEYNDASKLFEFYEQNYPYADVVYVNWQMFGDNDQYYYDETKTVEERFPLPTTNETQKESVHIKSFIKKNKMIRFSWNPHMAVPRSGMIITSDGDNIGPTPWNPNYQYKFCKLKHYVTKSLEEYIFRKYMHKPGDSNNESGYDFDYYFRYNEKTDEALKALEDLKIKYNL